MPVYGRFRMLAVEPDKTWTADYIVPKGNDVIQFWNLNSDGDKSDVFLGSARLGKEETICDVASTSAPPVKKPNFYQALVRSEEHTSELQSP